MRSRLRQAMKLAGVSKKGFARQMTARIGKRGGGSADTLDRYLTGESAPSVEWLLAAADELRVRSDWLLLNRGVAEEPAVTEQVNLTEFYAAFLPPERELRAWHDLVGSLPLDNETAAVLRQLPTTILNARDQLDTGFVQTPAGKRVWRPGPEVREAMGLELRAWLTFLDAVVEDLGAAETAVLLRRELPHLRQRFNGGLQILQPAAGEATGTGPGTTRKGRKTSKPRK